MTLLNQILEFNRGFVEREEYRAYQADRLPNKRLIVISCMDTRLTELLPKAMNIRNGDAKFIKTAGAVVSHPFGSATRSIMVAVYELGAEEICVVGHHGCGMANLEPDGIIEKMIERGVDPKTMDVLRFGGVDIAAWLRGFEGVEGSVRSSVDVIRNHPLLPRTVPVHGLIIHPETGALEVVVNGYEQLDGDAGQAQG